MTYLNEYEAEDVARIVVAARLDNLMVGARVLLELIEWTNSCSDGWTYWQKPRKAAEKLVTILEDRRRNHLRANGLLDCTETELRDALRPIKSFLTRQGINWDADLPWAAILPVHPTAVAEI